MTQLFVKNTTTQYVGGTGILRSEGQPFGYLVNGAKCGQKRKFRRGSSGRQKRQFRKPMGFLEIQWILLQKENVTNVLGSKEYKDQYCKEEVHKLTEELISLLEITKFAFCEKFTFCEKLSQFDDNLEPRENWNICLQFLVRKIHCQLGKKKCVHCLLVKGV